MMSLKKLELIVAAITLAAFILAMAFLPAISTVYIIGLGTLAMLYAIGGTSIYGTLNKPGETEAPKPKPRFLPLFNYLFTIPCIGMVFKLQSYPSPDFFLQVGLAALAIAAIVVAFNYTKTSYFNSSFVKRIAIYGGCCLVLLSLPKHAIVDIKYRNYPAFRDALDKVAEHPTDTAARHKMEVERRKANQ